MGTTKTGRGSDALLTILWMFECGTCQKFMKMLSLTNESESVVFHTNTVFKNCCKLDPWFWGTR